MTPGRKVGRHGLLSSRASGTALGPATTWVPPSGRLVVDASEADSIRQLPLDLKVVSYDFAVGRSLRNLEKLRTIGFAANRRLLGVQRTAHDGIAGEKAFRRINDPITISNGSTIAGLRFGDKRVHDLMHALIILAVLPGVVRARQLRSLLGTQLTSVGKCTPGRATYDLRRLRHHGLIERIPGKLAYTVTELGMRTALFYVHSYDALVGPGLADISPEIQAAPYPIRSAMEKWQKAWERHVQTTLQTAA